MRSITVTIHCDWPGCDVTATEAEELITERTLTVGERGAPKLFAVCKSHNDQLDEVLNPLLAKAIKAEALAVKPKKLPSSPPATGNPVLDDLSRMVFCQVPDCGRSFASNVGMAQHVTRTHDFESLASYYMQHPPTSG